MQARITKLLGSALIVLMLLPLAPVAEAVVNLTQKLTDAAGNTLIGGTLYLSHVGLENNVSSAKDDDNDGAVTIPVPDDNHDYIAWYHDADGKLVRRELWVVRGGKLVKTNALVLDYGPAESSYCSPSCDLPSSVVGVGPWGWFVPALAVGGGAILLLSDGGSGDSDNGTSTNNDSSNTTPVQNLVATVILLCALYDGSGGLSWKFAFQGAQLALLQGAILTMVVNGPNFNRTLSGTVGASRQLLLATTIALLGNYTYRILSLVSGGQNFQLSGDTSGSTTAANGNPSNGTCN